MVRKVTLEDAKRIYSRYFPYIHPSSCEATARFFHEEAGLIEESLEGVVKEHPRLQEALRSVCFRTYFPMQSVMEIHETHLPMLREYQRQTEEMIEMVSAQLNRYSIGNKATRESLEILSRESNDLKALIEETEKKLPDFKISIAKVIADILFRTVDVNRRVYRGPLILVELGSREVQINDINVRDEIYREALDRDYSLLGWDIKFLGKFGKIIAKDNKNRWQLYESLDPDVKEALAKQELTIVYPGSSGTDRVNAGEHFEKVLPRWGLVEESEAFERAINEYFERRIKKIQVSEK